MKEFQVDYSYMIVDKHSDYVDSGKESFLLEALSLKEIDTKEVILKVRRIVQQKCKKNEHILDANYYAIEEVKWKAWRQMHKSDFVELLESAMQQKKGIEVSIHLPGLPLNEIIYNGAENVGQKAMYYIDSYDESMRLNNNKDIRIVNAVVK